MKDELISFETAKLAKEKRFDVETLYFYCKKGLVGKMELRDDYDHLANYDKQIIDYFSGYYNWNSLPKDNRMHMITSFSESNEYYYQVICSAPTQSLLQKWLREKHNIQINIFAEWNKKRNKVTFCNYIISLEGNMAGLHYVMSGFDTYEEALEAGLLEALKLIKKRHDNITTRIL